MLTTPFNYTVGPPASAEKPHSLLEMNLIRFARMRLLVTLDTAFVRCPSGL
jgi:hypothetical protein